MALSCGPSAANAVTAAVLAVAIAITIARTLRLISRFPLTRISTKHTKKGSEVH